VRGLGWREWFNGAFFVLLIFGRWVSFWVFGWDGFCSSLAKYWHGLLGFVLGVSGSFGGGFSFWAGGPIVLGAFGDVRGVFSWSLLRGVHGRCGGELVSLGDVC